MSQESNLAPPRSHVWETVHVFVSSTFNDMHGERDYLVKHVFPELREWCEERKLRLIDIDLRWGVSEADATHHKRVIDVCLRNIDRCRPFFLCLVGQRYGWIPGQDDVSDETLAKFVGLADVIADRRSITEMEILHAVVSPFVENGRTVEAEHAFFYLRLPDYLEEIPVEPAQLRRTYSDSAEEDPSCREFLLERQSKLRKALEQQTQRPVCMYKAHWQPDQHTPELAMALSCPATLPKNQARWRLEWLLQAGVSIPEEAVDVPNDQLAVAKAYNRRLCAGRLGDFRAGDRSLGATIVADLKTAILKRYPERSEPPIQDGLSRELDRHQDFIRTATDAFIEREGDFAGLDAYANGNSHGLYVLAARAGSGKSTLLARWVELRRKREGSLPGESVHARFVGVTGRSSNVDSLLRSILEELSRTGKLVSKIPDNANVLRSEFASLLGESGRRGPVVVVIDALDQLESGISGLDWMPRNLPEDVKLIVSYKLGDEASTALAAQLREEGAVVAEVPPFTSIEHRESLVAAYLRQYLKELDGQHLYALVRAEGADNPLFLKVVISELRVFGAFAQIGEVIKREFGHTPENAFEAVLRRLENDSNAATVPACQAVPRVLGLLVHSRAGLPDDLLVRAFLVDLGLENTRADAIPALIRLLLRQVRPFLARRDGKTDFFYDAFRVAAKKRYTGDEAGKPSMMAWHRLLAQPCRNWRTLTGASQRYALENLAYHEAAAGNTEAAAAALASFAFQHDRLMILGSESLAESVTEARMLLSSDGIKAPLREELKIWTEFLARNSQCLNHRS